MINLGLRTFLDSPEVPNTGSLDFGSRGQRTISTSVHALLFINFFTQVTIRKTENGLHAPTRTSHIYPLRRPDTRSYRRNS